MSSTPSTDAIVGEYIGYATNIAREWVAKVPSTIDPADIHSAAYEGLSSAAERFDPNHGASFATFARSFIIGRIKSMLRKLDGLTRGERQTADEIRNATNALEQILSRLPTAEEISAYLGLEIERIREISRAESLLVMHPLDDTDERDHSGISDIHIPEETALVAEQNQHIRLAVETLPESMREVIEMVYFQALGVNEVAERLGITHEAVSQRHMKGRELLRNSLAEFVGREVAIEEGRVSQKQRNNYLESFYQATSDPSALLRTVEFAA